MSVVYNTLVLTEHGGRASACHRRATIVAARCERDRTVKRGSGDTRSPSKCCSFSSAAAVREGWDEHCPTLSTMLDQNRLLPPRFGQCDALDTAGLDTEHSVARPPSSQCIDNRSQRWPMPAPAAIRMVAKLIRFVFYTPTAQSVVIMRRVVHRCVVEDGSGGDQLVDSCIRHKTD